MWRYRSLALVLVFLLSCSEQHTDCAAIHTAVKSELSLHPHAQLADLYKFFFQDEFGPGHMIPNEEFAAEYLHSELAEATGFDSALFQPLGVEHNFYRVNLKLIADGRLAADSLLSAFVRSANSARPPALEEWKKEWAIILHCIDEMSLPLPEFAVDKQRISDRLKKGTVVGHHSEAYIQTHHPHYRIVSKKYYERLRRQVVEK